MRPTTSLTLCVVLTASTWHLGIGQTNMLNDGSFENVNGKAWKDNGLTKEWITDDVIHGTYALKCTNRDRNSSGVLQSQIPVKRGAHYAFEGYVKLLNDSGERLWQILKAVIIFDTKTGNSKDAYNIATLTFSDKSQGWIFMNGSIEAIQKDIRFAKLMLNGPDPGVNFLVDDFKLYEVPENPNWRAEADRNIEKHRKSNVSLRVSLPDGVTASDVDVEISLKRHLYPFGCLLRHYEIMETPTNQYSKLAFYFCNWASIQSYKWKYAKGKDPDNDPDFSNALIPTDIARAHGMKVRAHSVFWDIKKNIPPWLYDYEPSDLLPRLNKHLAFMFNITKGKVEQWDLQNEYLAPGLEAKYYERKLQDKNVTKNLFRRARELDQEFELYLNEFQCVTTGAQTEQLYDLAMEFKREGVPIDGIGIQGHTKLHVKPDPTAMWKRLDRLAMTGLDIMMTEFDLTSEDDLVRADWFEDTIRAFFGHPKLTGIILWGFYEELMREPNKGLVEGTNLTIVESGQRWACLVKKEWTTKKKVNLGNSTDISFRGFHGDYEVVVKRNGVAVQVQNFTLGKQDTDWDLSVTESEAEVEVPQETDYVPQCISHREEKSVAEKNSTSSDNALTCRTLTSAFSEAGENGTASISCDEDEVMTGCSSSNKEDGTIVKGEKIETDESTGKVVCAAYNGRNNVEGTKAYARCCKLNGLTCDYRTAGPSFPFDGAMAEARCRPGALALGRWNNLSADQLQGLLRLSYEKSSTCIRMVAHRRGQCLAVQLTCSLDRYRSSPLSRIHGGTFTTARLSDHPYDIWCSAYSAYPESDGAKPSDDLTSCVAQSGEPTSTDPGERSGVLAFSACCKATPKLSCTVVTSKSEKSSVICKDGYVMTGCNAYAEKVEKSFGAKMYENSYFEGCQSDSDRCSLPVSPGPSPGSTTAKAVCCKNE